MRYLLLFGFASPMLRISAFADQPEADWAGHRSTRRMGILGTTFGGRIGSRS